MKKRGIGISIGEYPTGMSGGGDSSQAIVKVRPDGTADLIVGSCDMGQGAKTALAQIAAEELGIAYEQMNVVNDDTDVTPLCFGTFASRVTFVAGNATRLAAAEAKQILFEIAANDLEAAPEDLESSNGKIFVKGAPDRSVTIAETANKGIFGMRKLIVGRGHYMRTPSGTNIDTGECDPFATLAWAGALAEVEVDTETGEVDVKRVVCVYDMGKAINPMMMEGQIEGGTMMAVGAALSEHYHPYWPTQEGRPTTLGEYIIPTTMDVPEISANIYECPSVDGPYGAKGIGEMTANVPPAAIANAVHDAVGVWIDTNPITPEKVLRALAAKEVA